MNETIWILEGQQWKLITDVTEVNIHKCLQHLALWNNENPMDITDGIDYVGVREQRVFLKSAIENITNQYLDNFDYITVSELRNEHDRLLCDITFVKADLSKVVTLENLVGN